MTEREPDWRILALRYGTARRPGDEMAFEGDPHDTTAIDYFIWAVRVSEDEAIVVDTGFAADEATRRGRIPLAEPADLLASVGVDVGSVRDVVITHLHYDHAGNLGAFPSARFHIQDAEMAYATGRCMCHPWMRRPFAVECVTTAVRMVYANRMVFHDGDDELSPGITLHRIGGHSAGLQAVRVALGDRIVVLASDAAHFYGFLDDGAIFPVFHAYPEVRDGYARLKRLAGRDGIIVPGHDPLVNERFPRHAGLDNVLRIA